MSCNKISLVIKVDSPQGSRLIFYRLANIHEPPDLDFDGKHPIEGMNAGYAAVDTDGTYVYHSLVSILANVYYC